MNRESGEEVERKGNERETREKQKDQKGDLVQNVSFSPGGLNCQQLLHLPVRLKLIIKVFPRVSSKPGAHTTATWPASPLPTLQPPVPPIKATTPPWYSQPIIAALIRAPSTGGRMALPWRPAEVMAMVWSWEEEGLGTAETSGRFNLGLVKIHLIKSQP